MNKKKNTYDVKEIYTSMKSKIKELVTKKNNICKYFIKKVDEISDGAPDYYNLIPVPCYLSLILDRLENLYYISFDSIIFDFNLIKQNCLKYNGINNPISHLADKLYFNLITVIEEVLKSFDINTDFINEYKISKNNKLNLDDLTTSRTNSNKRLLRNINTESKNNQMHISINGNKSNTKNDLDSLETKSENEYDVSRFNFENSFNDNKKFNYQFVQEEEKIKENQEIKVKGKRGRKKKFRPEENNLELNTNANVNNLINNENVHTMNSIEISNSKFNEDNESSEIKVSNDNYEIKIDDNINKEINIDPNYSLSRRFVTTRRGMNNISIPINDLNNDDSIRATRNRKMIKYNENIDDLSLDSEKSEKFDKNQNVKKRGRSKKLQSDKKINDDYSIEDFREENDQENEEYSLNTRSLGRKRNRQIIKFEYK